MQNSLWIAALLILAVLYLFLRDLRSALIAFSAIPLSLLAATVVLARMGYTLNTMTLGGFAVALGVLVDDAIIGIENILRRLRVNADLAQPSPRLEVIAAAAMEVRGPVIYATAVGYCGVLAGDLHHQRTRTLRRPPCHGLHSGGSRLSGRGHDHDPGTVRAAAARP
jgi:Cu/Ag efflux pump CusA